MRKILFAVIFISFSATGICQNDKYYKIGWKLSPDEILIYKTQMEQVDTAKYEGFQLDLDKIFAELPDSLKEEMLSDDGSEFSKAREFFKSLKSIGDNYNMYSVLSRNPDESIDVKMIMKKSIDAANTKMDSLMQIFTQLNNGVVLRGKINRDGSIGSFYLKPSQKNLLALYFELPSEPVRIGDHWSLEVNLLEFDQNFVCHNSEKRNDIELIEVEEVDGELIAYIRYDIYEMVEGDFNNPFSKKAIPTFMHMSYTGINEFSITNGRWKRFNCMSKTESGGVSKSFMVQTNVMIPADDVSIDDLLNK